MASKSSDWQPGPSVCRCCLGEGCYKDISTEYFWMGKREVYAEMLTQTLDLEIAFSQNKGPNSNSRLICESCISRLRDATEFKRQVQECEKTFMQHLDIEKDPDPIYDTEEQKDVKLECVKEEQLLSDDDDDRYVPPDFPDDDDDDLDDEPLTKLVRKVPKKESIDMIEEFLDEDDDEKPVVVLKRKSTTKNKASSAKKSKVAKKTSDTATASKAKPEKKKKVVSTEDGARENAKFIILYTTAYPFRVNDKKILCVYCGDRFDDPEYFRKHMVDAHESFEMHLTFHNLPKTELVKVEITDLKCRVCDIPLDNLNDAASHLESVHEKQVTTDLGLGVMPFTLEKDVWACSDCKKVHPTLLHLNKHASTHYLTCVCDICGKGYFAKTSLIQHLKMKHKSSGGYCRSCKTRFSSMEEKIKHRKTEKSCMPYCCTKCQERFVSWTTKQLHMVKKHGMAKKVYKCDDCAYATTDKKSLYVHCKLSHSTDCPACSLCNLRFASNRLLQRHVLKRHDDAVDCEK